MRCMNEFRIWNRFIVAQPVDIPITFNYLKLTLILPDLHDRAIPVQSEDYVGIGEGQPAIVGAHMVEP